MRIGYVAIGSNLGDRASHLASGLDGMARRGLPIAAVSSVWETEPVDSPEPLWFLNLVARIRTERSPLEILDVLLDVEREAGRVRGIPNAPRVLDLDLLVLDAMEWQDSRLVLPHPRMWQRRFVLAPLAELASDLRNPRTGRSVVEELGALRDSFRVRRFGTLASPRNLPL